MNWSPPIYDGSIIHAPVTLQLTELPGGTSQLQFTGARGLYYKIQSTADLGLPFTDEPGGATLAFDVYLSATNSGGGSQKFYRAACLLGP